MVLKFIAWLSLVATRLAAWLVGLVLKGIGKWVLVVVALLGEEFRRYAGLALSGTLIVVFGKLILALPDMPGKRWAVLFIVFLLATWAMAVRRSVRHTMRNNMERVRARTRQKRLAGEVSEIRGKVTDNLAQRAKGTPVEGAFSANRSARREEQAATRRTAEQAAERAERERLTREQDDQERDRLAALEPDPFT